MNKKLKEWEIKDVPQPLPDQPSIEHDDSPKSFGIQVNIW